MTSVAVSVAIGALGAGCSSATKEGAAGQKATRRVPAVPSASPNYDHFEGVAFANSCDSDRDCHAAGCSGEVCSADAEVTTVCTEYPDQPKQATCGCVRNLCIWYVMGGPGAPQAVEPDHAPTVRARPEPSPLSTLPDQGQKCPDGRCAPGLDCITYFGPNGPKGGTLSSCEVSCLGGRSCPRGQSCVTVKDGPPGNVCRPDKK